MALRKRKLRRAVKARCGRILIHFGRLMPLTKLDPPSVGRDGNNGGGHHRNGDDGSGGFESRISTAKLLMYLFIGSLAMMFGALAMMYLVRGGERLNYPFDAPESLWFSTLFIALSSGSMHASLLRLKEDSLPKFKALLLVTLLLGVLFLLSQSFSWNQVYQTITNSTPSPVRNLFYILTGVHAAHLFGGLAWIAVVVKNAREGRYSAQNRLGPELCGIYWHFLGASWLGFFLILMFR